MSDISNELLLCFNYHKLSRHHTNTQRELAQPGRFSSEMEFETSLGLSRVFPYRNLLDSPKALSVLFGELIDTICC